MRGNSRSIQALRARARRGGMMALLAFLLIVVIAAAALTIDIAYMQLVNTELQVSLDASSRAGVEALARAQSPAEARAAAVRVAKLNPVAGRELALKTSDIEIGAVARQADGSYNFVANGTPYSAVRINKELSEAAGDKSVSLFLGGFLGRESYTPVRASTSAFHEQEVCLVIDRSHSMCFDLTGVDWSYPTGTPNTPHPICYKPHPTKSRWASLSGAIDTFLDTVDEVTFERPRVSLVTWSADVGAGTVEYYYTKKTEVAVKRDVALTDDYDEVAEGIKDRGKNVMLGGTNLSAGMNEGAAVLNGSNVKPYAKRVMIVMTDGQWNQGSDPTITAQSLADDGIVIHCVSFLGGNQTTMERIAEIGGGRHFYAGDEDKLRDTFEELARMLPVVTIQ